MASDQARLRPSDEDAPRPHHISSIAHMFFTDGAPAHAHDRVAVRDVGVAAAASARVASWAAAALAWSLAGEVRGVHRVSLAEAIAADESARAWLPCESLGGEGPEIAPGIDHVEIGVGGVAQDLAQQSWVRWRHLGVPTPEDVAAWERLDTAPRLAGGRPPNWSGLVWCLRESETGRLEGACRLGRLAAVMRPTHLELLVVPDAATSFRRGRPGVGSGFDAARLRETVSAVVPGVPLSLTVVPNGESGGLALPAPEPVAADLLALARRAAAI